MPSCFPSMNPLIVKHNPFVQVIPKVDDSQVQGAVVTPDSQFMCNTYTNRPTQLLGRNVGGTAVRSGDSVNKIYKYSTIKPF